METNKLLAKRIKLKREELGYTQEDLAKSLGMNKSTIQRYENGNIKKIKLPVVDAIAQTLKVNPSWLVGKTNEETNEIEISNIDNIFKIEKKKIPLLGEIACGEPIYADEDRESYVMCGTDIDADFCLKAKGDSMINARIMDGDIVFVKKQPIVDNGEIAVVLIDDEATLKRFYYDKEASIVRLVAENPAYKTMVYSGDELNEIRILGKAVAFQSDVV